MRKQRVSDVTATRGRPPPTWQPWLDANWWRVRVTHAEVRRAIRESEEHLRIRTVVQLGALLPADVHVDVCPRAAAERESSGGGILRLWSVQSYRNGAFVFEATVPDREVASVGDRELVVRVRPARGDPERPLAGPVVAPIPPCDAGLGDGDAVPGFSALDGNTRDERHAFRCAGGVS